MTTPATGGGIVPGIVVPEQVRNGLLDAEFNQRYYQELNAYYTTRDNAIRIATGITSPATVGSILALESFPGFKAPILVIAAIFGVAAAVLAVVGAVLGYQSKLTDFGVQYSAWCQVRNQFWDLYLKIGNGGTVSNDELAAAAKAAAGASANELKIPIIEKLRTKCYIEVCQKWGLQPA